MPFPTPTTSGGRQLRILIIENASLLSAGLASLFAEAQEVEVIALPAADAVATAGHVRAFRPDLVVLEETAQHPDPLCLLAELRDHPMLRVLIVRADDNLAYLYGKSQVHVSQVNDLVSLISEPC